MRSENGDGTENVRAGALMRGGGYSWPTSNIKSGVTSQQQGNLMVPGGSRATLRSLDQVVERRCRGCRSASPVPLRPPDQPRARELCLESVEAQSDAWILETRHERIVL